MKKIMIGIIAIIIAITLVVAAFMYTGTSEYFEDEFGPSELGGQWGTEILLEYTDGSTQSLKMLFDNPTMAMYHGGNEIAGMYYILNGKASEGSGSIEIDISDFAYQLQLWQGSTEVNIHVTPVIRFVSSPVSLPVDDNWHELFTIHNTLHDMGASRPDGAYTLKIEPRGLLNYRVSGGNWIPVELPSIVSFNVEIQTVDDGEDIGGNIVVSFSQGYTTY